MTRYCEIWKHFGPDLCRSIYDRRFAAGVLRIYLYR